MAIDFISTVKGSFCEGFLPEGWDLAAFDKCCAQPPETITKPQTWWHKKFQPIPCQNLSDFEIMMGHEIALHILLAKEAGKQIVFILPVGPMGMYRWAVYFLTEWRIDCKHFHGFNMDEWSDEKGSTVDPSNPQSFQYAMEDAFYGPLGKLTAPQKQRHFATKSALPRYPEQIGELRDNGAPLVVVFGIGRVCHIAFWEPHFAAEFKSVAEWKKPTHRIGARLHPLTIEQNAITSFKSRTTLVSCYANTIGPGLFLGADAIIGGADGALGRGMMWQGMSLCVTLRLKPTPWVPSTFMTTQPGKLFFLKELAGPLEPECN